MDNYNSLEEMLASFPDENAILTYLEELRWNGIVISPFAENSKVYRCSDHKFKCRDTGKYFNVKTFTIFHNSRIDLRKWFSAIWIVAIERRQITSVDLAKKLGLTQKTAWYMMQRIRKYFDIKKNTRSEQKSYLQTDEEILVDHEKLKMSDWLTMLKSNG